MCVYIMKRAYNHKISTISPRNTSTPNSYNVVDYANHYKFPPYASTSAIVSIISFGGKLFGTTTDVGPNVVQLTDGDVHAYWTSQGILDHSTVYVAGNMQVDVGDPSSATVENTMDISIVGSICKCIIILNMFSQTTTFTQAVKQTLSGIIVNGKRIKPTHISISWGCAETSTPRYDMISVNALFKSSKLNICVASGDYGSTDGHNSLTVDFPSSSPHVIAVGGTSLSKLGLGSVETVWNNGDGHATGGGISRVFKSVYPSKGMRNVPDIAFPADPYTGINLIINGISEPNYGGTSMSAPLVVGYLALIGCTAPILPFLYKNTSCFNSNIIGNNIVPGVNKYKSKPGYDNCTGLGSIRCDVFHTRYVKSIPYLHLIVVKNQIHYATSSTSKDKIVWATSDPSVATVSNGLVSFKRAGQVLILAVHDGMKSTINVASK